MKHRRAKPKTSARTLIGLALIGAVLVTGIGLLAAPMLMRETVALDGDGCLRDAPTPAHALVFVDASEALAARHKRLLNAAVQQAARTLPPYGRLSLVTLDADQAEEPRWLLSLCSPGVGADANPLFANPARLRAAWEKRFAEPVALAARRMGDHRGDAASPIVASLMSATRDPRWRDAQARTLILVSDLMENAPGVRSLYDAATQYQPERDGALALQDAAVRVVMIDRPGKAAVQSMAWQRFWAPLLDASDAAEIDAGGADALAPKLLAKQ